MEPLSAALPALRKSRFDEPGVKRSETPGFMPSSAPRTDLRIVRSAFNSLSRGIRWQAPLFVQSVLRFLADAIEVLCGSDKYLTIGNSRRPKTIIVQRILR